MDTSTIFCLVSIGLVVLIFGGLWAASIAGESTHD